MSQINYLFDLDGVLINSEELYLSANRAYFRRFGVEFSEALHREGTGRNFSEWITTVVDIDRSGPEILEARNAIFYKLARKSLRLMNGAEAALKLCNSRGRVGLVTSSGRSYVDFIFAETGIGKYFETVVTGDQVNSGKPDPESYLTAAANLDARPKDCIVFEDSPAGVTAGKNAGMIVIAVPSRYVRGDPAFSRADVVLNSLEDFTPNSESALLCGRVYSTRTV